jgi:ketosteroid isomerase-like protein
MNPKAQWTRAVLAAFAASALAADPTTAVREAAVGWMEAFVNRDRGRLDRLLADDLTFAYSDGMTVQTKPQYLAFAATSQAVYETFSLKDIAIHVYGNSAVVSASFDIQHSGHQVVSERLMQLYVKKAGRWQLTASGATPRKTGTGNTSPPSPLGSSVPSYISDNRASNHPEASAVHQAALGWTQAMVRKDRTAIEPLLAENLLFAHSDGSAPRNKLEHLSSTETNRYEGLPLSDVRVRVFGDTALLTGYIDTKNVGRSPFRVRTIQIFVKNSGRWQLAAFQSTRITQPSRE